jgi:hypothetical protein
MKRRIMSLLLHLSKHKYLEWHLEQLSYFNIFLWREMPKLPSMEIDPICDTAKTHAFQIF